MDKVARFSGWAIAIHGGAGSLTSADLGTAEQQELRDGLSDALDAGIAILTAGGGAVDAVQASVVRLEELPCFNAGRGAAFTSAGTIELDAAIMDGRDLRFGGMAGLSTTRSPVSGARSLMEKGPHIVLAGADADRFAGAAGIPQVDNSWFHTAHRRAQLDEMLKAGPEAQFDIGVRFGTVGAVARDVDGHLAAATSTGGLTGKMPGRIGDSAIIGGGTLADDRSCAVSTTGSGEIFMRVRVAGQIADRIRFGGETLRQAMAEVLAEVEALGGTGGIIAVDREGDPLFALNALSLNRARANAAGLREIALFAA